MRRNDVIQALKQGATLTEHALSLEGYAHFIGDEPIRRATARQLIEGGLVIEKMPPNGHFHYFTWKGVWAEGDERP